MDKDSVKLDADKGALTFTAKKGQSLDPDALLDAIMKTTFHAKLNHLEVKVLGRVVVGEKVALLKGTGGKQQFTLGPDPDAKPKDGEVTPFERLKKAVGKGDKVVSVTGRVNGWGGDFRRSKKDEDPKPEAPAKPKGPPLLLVIDFEIEKK